MKTGAYANVDQRHIGEVPAHVAALTWAMEHAAIHQGLEFTIETVHVPNGIQYRVTLTSDPAPRRGVAPYLDL